ncbi:MAG: Mur ligase family protein [Myxococcota bacterium]
MTQLASGDDRVSGRAAGGGEDGNLPRRGRARHIFPGMHVHFIAVAGTGMGALAGLFQAAGHRVTGSDTSFYPPMGPALRAWGVELFEGFSSTHLEPAPDLVVVGNVCRPDHVEARAAIDSGLAYTHLPGALAEHILVGCSPLVVAGTHGKTTTSSICAWLLEASEAGPGFLIGGIPGNFERSFQLPRQGLHPSRLPLARPTGGRKVPFVIEGDEYDTAFFEKTPKFWHYRPEVAVVTSVEHDHIDIYPDEASYHAAFAGFLGRLPATGLVVAYAGDPDVVRLVEAHASCDVAWYALDGDDTHGRSPHWMAARAEADHSGQAFDLFAGGMSAGRGALPLSGEHNLRNAVGALGAVVQGFGVGLDVALRGLTSFKGVARRQQLLGRPGGIAVYDDFAHHPTAVRETLRGLKRMAPRSRLWAIYEPRTATACRRLHQDAYLTAFDAADITVLAPLGRPAIPDGERLDLTELAAGLRARGLTVERPPDLDTIVSLVVEQARPGDAVALLSNGAFGGIHQQLVESLRNRYGDVEVSP